jgi:hypothetical protein
MRRVLLVALALSLAAPASSLLAAAGGAGDGAATASISGTAKGAVSHAAANATVRLRNLANGQVSATTTANAAGQFSFTGLTAGNYVVEFVNAAGSVIATSAQITVAAGAAVTGVGVAAAAAAGVAAGGASSIIGIAAVAATGAAVAGVTVAGNRPDASGSR